MKEYFKTAFTYLALGLLFFCLLLLFSCDFKSQVRGLGPLPAHPSVDVFKREVAGNVKDLQSDDVKLDTFYVLPSGGRYSVSAAHFFDSIGKQTIFVVGVENFRDPMPMFTIIDSRPAHYVLDSVSTARDSLFMYMRAHYAGQWRTSTLGFDLKFNGKSFPWRSQDEYDSL